MFSITIQLTTTDWSLGSSVPSPAVRAFYLIAPIIPWGPCPPILFLSFFEEWGLDCRNVTDSWDNKGDIRIGNGVWIGYEAVILAGVTIGNGVIVGAHAVVTSDVPPYPIVGGIPAKPIRKRFSGQTITALLACKWWDWPKEKTAENIGAIQSGDIEKLR